MTHFIENYGLVFLFAVVCLESAGLWLPGESRATRLVVIGKRGLDRTAIAAGLTAASMALED